jgi:glycine/D-amino acid oxidase-like deaminating enzyme
MSSELNPAGEYQRQPKVTIFGAGIAGLTAAHELIERGFEVHVIEKQPSPTEEYACQVGGMAANQLSRVKIDLEDLIRLFPEYSRTGTSQFIALERTLLMQPVRSGFPYQHVSTNNVPKRK